MLKKCLGMLQRLQVADKVIGTFFKEFVSEYKVGFKDISAGI